MKNSEIMRMLPGKEMDAVIARGIFSRRVCMTFKEWRAAGTPLYNKGGEHDVFVAETIGGNLPKYSSNIETAFDVAQKLGEIYDFAILNNQHFKEFPNMTFGFRLQALDDKSHIKTIFALGETIPLVICRGALFHIYR